MSFNRTVATERDAVNAVCELIAQKRADELEQRAEQRWRPRRNYASGMVDCARNQYYNRVLWEHRKGIPPNVHGRLEVGEWGHEKVVQWFQNNGFNVRHVELPLESDELEVGGRVDLVIAVEFEDGRIVKIPVEIKTATDNAWSMVRDVEAMQRQEWTRKYIRQLWFYMVANKNEAGILFVLGMPSGTFNPIPVYRDDERIAVEVEAFCKTVNEAVAAHAADTHADEDEFDKADKHAPARIEYDDSVCGRCTWFKHCLPATSGNRDAIKQWTDEDLIGMVSRHQAIKPIAQEFAELDKKIKGRLKGHDNSMVGAFLCTGKMIKTRRFQIPKEENDVLKGKHPEWHVESEYWRLMGIERIEGEEKQTASEQREVVARLRRLKERAAREDAAEKTQRDVARKERAKKRRKEKR